MAKFGIALGSGPRGLGFESRYSDQKKKVHLKGGLSFLQGWQGFEPLNATVRWTVACRRLDGGNSLICSIGANATNPDTPTKKKRGWLMHPLFFLVCAGIRKADTSALTGVKIESWRAIFRPWENPLIDRRIQYGCG